MDLVSYIVLKPDGERLPFDVPPAERSMLLRGIDTIGLTLKRHKEIESFQQADRLARPWIWAHSCKAD